MTENNKVFYSQKALESDLVIFRREHICEYQNLTLDLHKKMSYQKGIFFKKTLDDISLHLGVYVENIHTPITRKDTKVTDLIPIGLDVNENYYMSRSSFVKKKK